jgi:hypothetical protein
VLAAEGPGIPGDPDRDARGAPAIAPILVEPIRALARVEDQVGEVEPPSGKAQSLAGLGALPLEEGLLERRPRGLPVAPGQRLVARLALGRSRLRQETRS